MLAKDRAALHGGRKLVPAVEIYLLFGERARQLRVGTALQGMCRNASPAKMDLSNSRLVDPAQLAMLAAALISNTSVLELRLDGNKFGSAGALHIATGLRSNKTLRKLSLLKTNIGPEGVAELHAALGVNFHITELVLDCDGAEHLALNVSLNQGEDITRTCAGTNLAHHEFRAWSTWQPVSDCAGWLPRSIPPPTYPRLQPHPHMHTHTPYQPRHHHGTS